MQNSYVYEALYDSVCGRGIVKLYVDLGFSFIHNNRFKIYGVEVEEGSDGFIGQELYSADEIYMKSIKNKDRSFEADITYKPKGESVWYNLSKRLVEKGYAKAKDSDASKQTELRSSI